MERQNFLTQKNLKGGNNIMKLKKILVSSGLIASVLACSMPAYATDDDNTTNIVLSINDEPKTLTTSVTYDDSAEFSVTIPKSISLGDDKKFTYSITVKGKISPETQINVEPVDQIDTYSGVNFYMTEKEDSSKKAIVGVKQDETSWLCNEVNIKDGTTKTGIISAQGLSVGNWEGSFKFNLSITEHIHDYQDGVCTICENEVTSFSKDSFEDIYEACVQGLANEYFNVGDTRTITLGALSGASNSPDEQEATIVIADIAEDGQSITCIFTSYDTLAPEKVINETYNDGDWGNMSIRTWLNGEDDGDFYNALPNDLKSSIKTHSSSYASHSAQSVSYSNDKVWLLSEKEVFGSQTDENSVAANIETQLDYFTQDDISTIRYLQGTSGTSIYWWLRSSRYSASNSYNGGINTKGQIANSYTSTRYYAFPAFEIGPNVDVDD
jgi:hypothetical protein